ncbi:cobalamin B12-binding domain-containing protein [Chloroflexota bacterium]
MVQKKVKVLMAKPGLEGHWIGMVVVSKALRDAGFEVIYGGNMSPHDIAAAAIQEDVDVVGISMHTANYMRLLSATMKELKGFSSDKLVVVGGVINEDDFPAIYEMGVAGIFTPGTPLKDIVDFVTRITCTN